MAVACHRRGSGVDCSNVRCRSASSIRCCVPTFRDGKRPERIQRRIVSGFLPVFLAASGTVSTGVAYYNTLVSGSPLSSGDVTQASHSGWDAKF